VRVGDWRGDVDVFTLLTYVVFGKDADAKANKANVLVVYGKDTAASGFVGSIVYGNHPWD